MTKAVIYAYGTLRKLEGPEVKVKGQLFDLGWFPGARLGGEDEFVAERIEVDDLAHIDAYEGYREDDHENSLYIRRPFMDGFIYEYNREVNPMNHIEGGDWVRYMANKRKGV